MPSKMCLFSFPTLSPYGNLNPSQSKMFAMKSDHPQTLSFGFMGLVCHSMANFSSEMNNGKQHTCYIHIHTGGPYSKICLIKLNGDMYVLILRKGMLCGEVECGNAIIAYSNRFDIRYRNLCYSCCLIVHLYNIVHNHMSIVK